MKPGISVYNISNEPVTGVGCEANEDGHSPFHINFSSGATERIMGRRFRKVNQPVRLQPLSEKICLVEPM